MERSENRAKVRTLNSRREMEMSKTLKDCQTEVHAWISSKADGYWDPHQIYTRLGSEVGELGKEINHEFGPLKKKADEKPSSVVEECGDILFTVICLLNSKGLSLDEAFRKSMAKCYGRDKDRFPQAGPNQE